MSGLLNLITGKLLGKWFYTILGKLGLFFVTSASLSVLLSWVISQVQLNVGGLPSNILGIMGLMRVDLAMNMIFSAYIVKIALSNTRMKG